MLEGDAQKSLVDNDIKEEIEETKKKFIPNKLHIILAIIGFGIGVTAIVILVIVLYQEDSDSSSNEKEEEKSLNFLTWEEAHKKAKEKLKDFTNEEKFNLLFGTENMQRKTEDRGCVGSIDPIENKFGGICLQDGPAGVRFSNSTQSWQASINTASTFNKSLMYEVGKAQGKEFREKGINVALGPAMNIQRNPQGGRIWECYGDDPFLSGFVATQIIKGIQSNGVIACAKHYVGNDQETNRKNSSSNIKEQALWEIYMEPFYRSVKDAEVGAIMAAYNMVNGTFCINNDKIINNYLKTKLGFKGYVMSDWWAITSNDTDIFNNGIDMNMPGGYDEGPDYIGRNKSYWSNFIDHLGKEIKEERLNDAVERILAPMFKLDQFNEDIKYPNVDIMKNTITDETKKINREAATQSNVLLKNDNDILPIKNMKGKTIAIIGNDAFSSPCIRYGDCSCLKDDSKFYQGHMALGYGSGTTYFNYLIDPFSAIKARAEKEGITIIYSGDINEKKETIDENEIYVGEEDINKAKEIAQHADLCIVFLNADSGEQYITLERSRGDRYNLEAWHKGNDLVEAVLKTNKPVIVVINSPGPIELPFLSKIQALIFSGFGGAESGNGLTDILFGDYNPSGHLPFVWAELKDYPSQIKVFSSPLDYDYTEGVFVGQRYFDKNGIKVTYPFGYGLSYTTFEFVKDLKVNMAKEGLKINFSMKNSGNMKGEAVPMVFLKFPDNIQTEEGYPDKLFKGFDKKWINPNETVSFEILVDDHALSYYNINKQDYERPNSGKYTVFVGFNANEYKKLQTEVDAKF